MTFFSMLKYNAKLALKGSWGLAVLVSAFSGVLYCILGVVQQFSLNLLPPFSPSEIDIFPLQVQGSSLAFFPYAYRASAAELVITALFTLFSILFLAPISLGMTAWFFDRAEGRQKPFSSLFRFFSSFHDFRRAILFEISMTVRSLLWAMLFLLLPAAVFVFSYLVLGVYRQEGFRFLAASATIGMLLSLALALLFLFLYAVHMHRYTLAPYLLCRYGDLTITEAVKQSIRLTNGYRFSLLWFQLSFAGWWILSGLFLFLPLLFLTPYINMANAMYARFLLERNQEPSSNETKEFTVNELSSQGLRYPFYG